MFIESTSIDLFDQNMDMVCAKGRLRYSWLSLVLIYLINKEVRHVPKLDSDVHAYYWNWFIWSKFGCDMCQS